ncbi:MAG: hypothetical protein KatS3mg103_0296 [Phycisphaerales bacterium]|nr:MAG: hypothetical protein KatS3mg103_0296 [Phycisphaerales bacterium]
MSSSRPVPAVLSSRSTKTEAPAIMTSTAWPGAGSRCSSVSAAAMSARVAAGPCRARRCSRSVAWSMATSSVEDVLLQGLGGALGDQGVDGQERAPAGLQHAQIGQDPALAVQQQGAGGVHRLHGAQVLGEQAVEQLEPIASGQLDGALLGQVHQAGGLADGGVLQLDVVEGHGHEQAPCRVAVGLQVGLVLEVPGEQRAACGHA